ncbi:hypothetical protein ElyMa_006476400 [Elysia marginata]|uniref:RHD domain-containing protein n=1 Tax=Elysia marginata TaxID=1093978 RepID=A0AAV4I219_9GAST|nr:hypothetical protein ElyMa_006476400 [Elysia marginata]
MPQSLWPSKLGDGLNPEDDHKKRSPGGVPSLFDLGLSLAWSQPAFHLSLDRSEPRPAYGTPEVLSMLEMPSLYRLTCGFGGHSGLTKSDRDFAFPPLSANCGFKRLYVPTETSIPEAERYRACCRIQVVSLTSQRLSCPLRSGHLPGESSGGRTPQT